MMTTGRIQGSSLHLPTISSINCLKTEKKQKSKEAGFEPSPYKNLGNNLTECTLFFRFCFAFRL